jgi:hypothetical protein
VQADGFDPPFPQPPQASCASTTTTLSGPASPASKPPSRSGSSTTSWPSAPPASQRPSAQHLGAPFDNGCAPAFRRRSSAAALPATAAAAAAPPSAADSDSCSCCSTAASFDSPRFAGPAAPRPPLAARLGRDGTPLSPRVTVHLGPRDGASSPAPGRKGLPPLPLGRLGLGRESLSPQQARPAGALPTTVPLALVAPSLACPPPAPSPSPPPPTPQDGPAPPAAQQRRRASFYEALSPRFRPSPPAAPPLIAGLPSAAGPAAPAPAAEVRCSAISPQALFGETDGDTCPRSQYAALL